MCFVCLLPPDLLCFHFICKQLIYLLLGSLDPARGTPLTGATFVFCAMAFGLYSGRSRRVPAAVGSWCVFVPSVGVHCLALS